MLVECSDSDCNVQFASDAAQCPVCGCDNPAADQPVIDVAFERAQSRRRMMVGVVAGLAAVGYGFSFVDQLSSGFWLAIPFSGILLFVWFKVFRTAIENQPPERLE